MDSTNICPTILVCAFLDSVNEEVLHEVEVGFLSVLPFLEFTKRAVKMASESAQTVLRIAQQARKIAGTFITLI